jgi:REP element-mobilizing transposase RayT
MPQSLAKNLVHLIFSTKNRAPVLNDIVREALHAYVAGILNDLASPALLINSVSDHLHVLFNLNKNTALTHVVMEVKRGFSKWLKTPGANFTEFHWQNGYGAFSVGESAVETVKHYIANQQDHHRRVTFQEEFRAFLNRYKIEFDERYVWA